MTPEAWKYTIQPFLEPHPVFYQGGDDVYVPRDDLCIAFLFEGGLRLVGDSASLEVNYNNPDLLIIEVKSEGTDRIYRSPWDRLVCFELIRSYSPADNSPEVPPRPD